MIVRSRAAHFKGKQTIRVLFAGAMFSASEVEGSSTDAAANSATGRPLLSLTTNGLSRCANEMVVPLTILNSRREINE